MATAMAHDVTRRVWTYRWYTGSQPTGPEMVFVGDPVNDRDQLCRFVALRTREAINHLDGGPEGGYGPRLRLAYWRKKEVLRLLRALESEAALIASTGGRAP